MNKGELVNHIASQADLSKTQAKDALEAVLSGIQGALKNDDKVTLIGFGTFDTRKKPAGEARVPGTNRVVKVPAKRVVKFKAGAGLKKSVN